MKVVLNRALSLATSGLLAGSALAIATHGFLQVPVEIDVPVIELPSATGGGTNIPGADFWLGVPEHFTYSADLRLLLSSQTRAWLEQYEPVVIETLEPTGLVAFYDAQAELHIVSEAEWKHIDQAVIDADDEEVFLLFLAYRQRKKDEPIFWNEPHDS